MRTSPRTASTTSSPKPSSARTHSGARVLGTADVIANIPIPDIESYHHARYSGSEIVVGAAGHLDHDAIVALAEKLVQAPSEGGGVAPMTALEGVRPGSASTRRRPSSTTSASARPASAATTSAAIRSAVLDAIFGGSTSSRLFREVREKRGLAYSVGSYNEQFTDQGLVATYVGTREDNVEEACKIIGDEMARLRSEPVSGEELARAKESVKGRLVLSSESTAARMTRISRWTCSACRSKASTKC